MADTEDAVLLDTLLLALTAPVWIAGFVVLAVAGWWNDRGEVARG